MIQSSGLFASALVASGGDERALHLATELAETDPAVLVHGASVGRLALRIADRLGLPSGRRPALRRAALLHDVGKRVVARAILDKPSPLLLHERLLMETHAEVGAAILSAAGLAAEATFVRHHHERWDGGGYPDRLRAEDIPLESRIIQVADAFDAMTVTRAYRVGLPVAAAIGELRRVAGSQVDPLCARLLVEIVACEGEAAA